MNKKEMIEKIEELLDNLKNYQSEAYTISEDIDGTSETLERISDTLLSADNDLDDAIDQLEIALSEANKLPELDKITTFAKVCDKFIHNKIMCNCIKDVDENLFDNEIKGNELEPIGEVMQYFLTDLNENDVEYITEHFTGFYFIYSEIIGLWVMLVDHWGTSWEYVNINTDLDL